MIPDKLYNLCSSISNYSLEEFISLFNNYHQSFEKKREIGQIMKDNNTIFRRASENGNIPVVRFLLEQNVDIHTEKDYAIRYSAANGHLDMVKFLVENGANIHAKENRTLQRACEGGYLDIVIYLMNLGAEPSCEHYRSIYSAVSEQHFPIIEYFMKKELPIKKILNYYKDEKAHKIFDLWLLNYNLHKELPLHTEKEVSSKFKI